MPARPVFLIDGTAMCYRAFHAIRQLSTANGQPTNAVYGFAMMLHALREKERPAYLAVAFDAGKPTFRHARFEGYKAQRKPMPPPLIAQLPVVKRLLAAYRIPTFECEGYEGEDVLATIAARVASAETPAFLVTADKDALQLITPHIKVYTPQREPPVWDADAVRARYGVEPQRLVDLMALMGDDTDNIPGVKGIGEKTASALVQRFGSLERLYAGLDEVEDPAQRQRLASARDQVALSRELATVHADAPVDVTLDALVVQEPDGTALRRLFRELEFKRLLAGLDAQLPASPEPASQDARVIEAPEDLGRLADQLRRQPLTAVGAWPIGTSSGDVLLAVTDGAAGIACILLRYEAMAHAGGRALAAWLQDPAAKKLAHDAKAVCRLLRPLGLGVQGWSGDTMVAAYLLNSARTGQSLRDVADEWLEERLPSIPAIDGAAWSLDATTRQSLARSVAVLPRLHTRLTDALTTQGLSSLYTELELPLMALLAEMEASGVTVDRRYLEQLRATMAETLNRLTDELHRMAGGSFNLNSPRQLARVLFEDLKLPIVKRTKTGPSTDSEVLQKLADQHPLPRKLMEYRELAKLVSTYVDALPQLIDPATGRLHTTWNQTATATGRLSSSDPNLQNIPVKTELGRSIRRAFVAGGSDHVLMAADYSQIELRILAHCSGDARLVQAFHEGRDIHRFTASLIYGIPEAEVQPEQRQAMKAINFGILYGMTPHGLSKELGLPREEAEQFIAAYFERYPGVRSYLDAQIAKARRDGFVQTPLGRRRYIPEVNSPDLMVRQFGERMAVNAPIQGTAADLIKRAMVQLAPRLSAAGGGGRLLLQVHDELVLEVPRAALPPLARLAREVMESAMALTVPLVVTIKAGPNWLDLVPVEI